MTPAELAAFHTEGYHVERGLFNTQELEIIRNEADRLLARTDLISEKNSRCRWNPHYETNEMLFDCFDPYFDLSPLLAEYAKHPRMNEMMRTIYGEPGHVCHNQLIFKQPGSKGYSLHQDYVSWPIFPKSFHTVAIALDGHDQQNGCIQAYRGYHRNRHLSPDDGAHHNLSPDMFDPASLTPLNLEPGDAVVFGCWLPHFSGNNQSRDRWRRTLFYCWNADSDGGEMREPYYEYYAGWKKEMAIQYGKPVLEFW